MFKITCLKNRKSSGRGGDWLNTIVAMSCVQVDPKDHEELKAAKAKLEQDLVESERAKEALQKGKAELLRSKAAVEKERDDANTIKGKMLATVIQGVLDMTCHYVVGVTD